MTRFAQVLRQPARIFELNRCISCTPNWFGFAKSYVLKQETCFPFTFSTRKGSKLSIADWDELTTVWHVFCRREYDVPKHAKTIVDLGANCGAFSVWAADNRPDAFILAVEPFPATYGRLLEHIKRNSLGGRVHAVNVAVAGHDGQVAFDATEGKRSYCRAILPEGSAASAVRVPCLSLASLLDQHGLNQVDCLKMDVEGGEYAIIGESPSEVLRRARLITMEYHDSNRAHSLWDKLEDSGFRRLRIAAGGWSGLATYGRID